MVIRPSGTEPKLKAYLQLTTAVPDGADLDELKAQARTRMSTLTDEIAAAIGLSS